MAGFPTDFLKLHVNTLPYALPLSEFEFVTSDDHATDIPGPGGRTVSILLTAASCLFSSAPY